MKRVLLALALMGMVATPAMADLISTVPQPKILATVRGVGALPQTSLPFTTNTITSPGSSVVVTFAFTWPYTLVAYAQRIQYSFEFDNSEVGITGFTPIGLFNSPPTQRVGVGTTAHLTPVTLGFFATAAPGTARKGIIRQTVGTSATPQQRIIKANTTVSGSTVNGGPVMARIIRPFLRVTASVKSVISDALPDLRVGLPSTDGLGGPGFSSGMIWNYFTITSVPVAHSASTSNIGGTVNVNVTTGGPYITGGAVFTFDGNAGARLGTPEPASAAMLGLGILSISGGIWRRRRRMHS